MSSYIRPIPGTAFLTTPSEVIPVPTPSTSPDDPLNWSKRRKLVSMMCMSLFTLSSGVCTASIYSILVPISLVTNVSLNTLNQGTGYMFLFLGLGCLFWQPIGQQYGKRLVYIVSLLLTVASQIWAAHAHNTSAHWIGSKIFQGFVQAPIESLCEVTISDVFFEHERGRWIGLYAFVLMFSNYIAPVVAGPIAQNQGWQWVLYWGGVFCGVASIVLFFLCEETNWNRGADYKPEVVMTAFGGKGTVAGLAALEEDKKSTDASNTSVANGSVISISQKTYWQKLSLLDKPRPMMLWTMFIRPFKLVTYPAIVYSGFLYGTGLIFFNILNATASLIFSAEPYNFSMTQAGLTYLSPAVVSGILGWGAGHLSDWIKVWLARRNRGVSESEHRLWILLVYLILVPPSLIIWGFGASRGFHAGWLILAMGLIGGSGTVCATASVTYAIDSYRDIASDSMVTLIIIRNLVGFCVSYGITSWVQNEGLERCFGEATGLCVGCILPMFAVIWFGKRWRVNTKERYWKMVDESRASGMAF